MAIRNILPIAAGVLALLALAGIVAAVVGRRRRRREQELADERAMAYEPFETAAAAEPVLPSTPEPAPPVREEPASAPPSAFAWGKSSDGDADSRSNDTMSEQGERRPGESWVERAYRGPSPSNPSVSLRHRLSRAAFFDKREREAAAGVAEPIDTSAGLSRAMIDEQERESA